MVDFVGGKGEERRAQKPEPTTAAVPEVKEAVKEPPKKSPQKKTATKKNAGGKTATKKSTK
jgi:hypothetical protein